MKNLELIKKELIDFTKSHRASDRILNSIKGNNLTELFSNIMPYIHWYKENKEKTEEFNSIFDNELVIEDCILLCNCTDLTAITIPDTVTVIGDDAFNNCSKLKSVKIGNSVTSIGNSAFYYCSELKSVKIGNSVISIGADAFSGCIELTSIKIPNSVTYIGEFAFYRCIELTSIKIPNSVTSIGHGVFRGL